MQNIVLTCKDAKEISTLFEIEIKKNKRILSNLDSLDREERNKNRGEKKRKETIKSSQLLHGRVVLSRFLDLLSNQVENLSDSRSTIRNTLSVRLCGHTLGHTLRVEK